jgi:hypothetical protein
MSDLFAEIFDERAAICEIEGGLPKEQAEAIAAIQVENFRHACEVRSVVAKYQTEGGEAVKAFLVQVAKHRGQAAADRLRADALKEIGK